MSAPDAGTVARLDGIMSDPENLFPALTTADHIACAHVISDHFTDAGSKLTAAGRTRDQAFAWYCGTSAYNIPAAYRVARGIPTPSSIKNRMDRSW